MYNYSVDVPEEMNLTNTKDMRCNSSDETAAGMTCLRLIVMPLHCDRKARTSGRELEEPLGNFA